MRKYILRWIIISITFLSSCSSYYPKVEPFVNTKSSGDIQVNAGLIGTSENTIVLGYDVAAAVAITDKSYTQFFHYSNISLFNKLSLDQFSGGYKFDLQNDWYIDASIGYTNQEIRHTYNTGTSIDNIDFNTDYGFFKIPFTKVQLVYDNQDDVLLAFSCKAGVVVPEIKNFDQNALLVQPSLTFTPTMSDKKSSLSLNCGFSRMFPISDHKIKFNDSYFFDRHGMQVSINYGYRFNPLNLTNKLKN